MSAALTKVIGELVKLYVTVQASVIRAVANGGRVKLVSPWLSPAMLIPLPYTEPDKRLYWRVFEPADGWNEQQMFVGQATSENPALALLNGKTYCIYRSAHNNRIYWTSLDPDGGLGQYRRHQQLGHRVLARPDGVQRQAFLHAPRQERPFALRHQRRQDLECSQRDELEDQCRASPRRLPKPVVLRDQGDQ